MIKIGAVWKHAKNDGTEYFKGKFGEAEILLFLNKSDHPKSPHFDIVIAKKSTQEERSGQPSGDNVTSPPKEDEDEVPF